MKNPVKKFGKALALSAVFIAAVAPAAQAQSTPEPAKTYASLVQRIDNLGDQSKQINMTVHTQEVLGLPTNSAEMTQLRQQLKKEISQEAPRILLAPGLSGPNIQSLLDSFKTKVGPLPDYLAKVDGQARFVPVCQSQLITPEDATDIATARDVADCVASKKGLEDKASVIPQAAPVVVQPAPQAQPPVRQTVTPPPKQEAPPPVRQEAAPPVRQEQAQPQETKASIVDQVMEKVHNVDGKTAGIAGGVAAVGLLGVFGIRRMRRKQPIDAYVPLSSSPDPGTPDAAAEKEPFQIRLKPKLDQSKQDDTPYTPPPKKFSL